MPEGTPTPATLKQFDVRLTYPRRFESEIHLILRSGHYTAAIHSLLLMVENCTTASFLYCNYLPGIALPSLHPRRCSTGLLTDVRQYAGSGKFSTSRRSVFGWRTGMPEEVGSLENDI